MEDQAREVTFHLPAFVHDGAPTTIEFSVKRVVRPDEHPSYVALEVLRSAPSELVLYNDKLDEQDFPWWLPVSLLRPGVTPADYKGDADDIAINFGVRTIGLDPILVFDPRSPEGYVYNTFGDLDLLADWGLLRGQRDHLVIRFVSGRGGDELFSDIASWLFSQGVDLGIELARDFLIFRLISPLFGHIRNGRRDRRARRVAANWEARGLEHPRQLREFIDFKESWTPDEVSKRLKINKESSRKLLKALGLEKNSRGAWGPGTSKRALRRRRRWDSAESDADLSTSEEDN